MSGIKDFELFVVLSWVLVITPGPDVIYVLTRGIAGRRRAGLVSAAGVTMGILVHTLFAALGLSVILQASALAFEIVKYLGAAYLIYLGIKTILGRKKIVLESKNGNIDNWKIFKDGVFSNVLNPKVALFFVAFLPQFIVPEALNNPAAQFVMLGFVFAFFGIVFLSVLGYFAGYVSQFLIRNTQVAECIQVISGLIMIALGIRLAFVKRSS